VIHFSAGQTIPSTLSKAYSDRKPEINEIAPEGNKLQIGKGPFLFFVQGTIFPGEDKCIRQMDARLPNIPVQNLYRISIFFYLKVQQ
jgi:hypothetical protein